MVTGILWYFTKKSTYSFTPGETCGMMLFDICLKFRPDVQIRLHPINMARVTVKTETIFLCVNVLKPRKHCYSCLKQVKSSVCLKAINKNHLADRQPAQCQKYWGPQHWKAFRSFQMTGHTRANDVSSRECFLLEGVPAFCSGSKSAEEALRVYGAVQQTQFQVMDCRELNICGLCKILELPRSNVARVILNHVIVIIQKYLYIKDF